MRFEPRCRAGGAETLGEGASGVGGGPAPGTQGAAGEGCPNLDAGANVAMGVEETRDAGQEGGIRTADEALPVRSDEAIPVRRDEGGDRGDGIHGEGGSGAEKGGSGVHSNLRGAEAGRGGAPNEGGGLKVGVTSPDEKRFVSGKVGGAAVPAIKVPPGGEERGGALRIPTRQEVPLLSKSGTNKTVLALA